MFFQHITPFHFRKKMVVIGDHGVGKTCFLTSYTTNAFPGEIVPRVCDSCTVTVNVDGIPYTVQIWDTAGEVIFL